jgi:hypothetical protein
MFNIPQRPGYLMFGPKVALLGGNRIFRRWGLVGDCQVTGDMPLKEILELQPLPPISLLPGLWGEQFAPPCTPIRMCCLVTQIKIRPPEPWTKMKLFLFITPLCWVFVIQYTTAMLGFLKDYAITMEHFCLTPVISVHLPRKTVMKT